jgi:hypothetical protein
MKTFIDQFEEIFAENEYKADNQPYCELNGKSSPKELKKYLEKHLQKFEREYIAVAPERKDDLYSTMLASHNRILTKFAPAYKEVMYSNNSFLKELFNVKLSVLKKFREFLNSSPTDAELNSKDTVYYFTVSKELYENYEIHLNRLYDGLHNLQLIRCTPVQFKMLFRPDGEKRMKTPEPIVWYSGAYSHLAYFIKYLVKKKFIKRTNLPSVNQIAQALFYDNEEERKFIISRIKSDIDDDSIYPYVDIKNMVDDKLRLKTRPSSGLKK